MAQEDTVSTGDNGRYRCPHPPETRVLGRSLTHSRVGSLYGRSKSFGDSVVGALILRGPGQGLDGHTGGHLAANVAPETVRHGEERILGDEGILVPLSDQSDIRGCADAELHF